VEKEEEQDLIEVSLYDLLVAFKDVVERESEPSTHEIVLEEITVKERFEYIRTVLLHRKRVPFVELIRSDPRKMVMVVTFLAILELIRAQLVAVRQQHPFGEIWVYRKIATGGGHHPFYEAP
jgi:segregation and condensation protein A